VTEERIRVALVRTGGFAGLELRTTLDTAHLPEAEARELAGLVQRVDFESLGPGGSAEDTGPGWPDAFHYRLSVRRGGRRWDGLFGEQQVPPELRPLLTKLVARARSGRAGDPP